MKKGKVKNKYFINNEEYFYFLEKTKDSIKILNVVHTHNYKIKVTYVIIK